MRNKLIVGLSLVVFGAAGAGACSSSSTPASNVDAGDDVVTVEDSGTGMDVGTPETSTVAEAGGDTGTTGDAATDAAVDGGDAAPSEAGPSDGGDAAVGDAE